MSSSSFPLLRSIEILDVRIDDLTMEETIQRCQHLIETRRGAYIATPNAEIVMAAQRNQELRQIINRSDLAIPDGAGLLLAARINGDPLRTQVAGTDVAEQLCALAADKGYRLFLLGGGPNVAAKAATSLRLRYRNLSVAGVFEGDSSPAGDTECRARIAAVAPVDIIFVGFGAPRQELWMSRNCPVIGVPLALGFGGAIDFLAGTVKRAPPRIRALSLDWLYRLIQQPWRWRRQMALPRFVLLVIASAVRRRLFGSNTASQ